jgi:putative photosynthetic complex assembly protein
MGFIHIDEEVHTGSHGVPKVALAIAGAFAVAVIALAGVARVSRTGTLGQRQTATPVASRALVFSDRPDGGVGVFDVQYGQELSPLPPGNGGFVRGALRALSRQRRLAHVGADVPFYLIKWSDGRLTLDDSATSNHLELEAYGSTNLASFEKLLKGPAP